MAKVPRAGNVKTRLRPFLRPEECQSLAEAFLFDAIGKTKNLCDDLIAAYAPSGEADYFSRFEVENLTTIEQRGADLGEKMNSAFDFVFGDSAETSVLMIGTDSPTFPPAYLEQAFAALEGNADVVLGASADGGFYLIGLKNRNRRIFTNIEWSSSVVFKQITRNIANLQLKIQNVPAWYDVDNADDLKVLRREMRANQQLQKIAPRTYRWLQANQGVFER